MAADYHHLVIVRRGEPGRFAALVAGFAGEPEVTILWDRRVGERRRALAPGVMERRGRDRRTPRSPYTWSALDFLVTTGDASRG